MLQGEKGDKGNEGLFGYDGVLGLKVKNIYF